MSASPSLVAFFGATGGCALSCLVKTLNAGIHSRALARTPAKLESLLLTAGVSKATLDQHLTVISGNALDHDSVDKTLRSDSGALASLIIFGVGARPKFDPLPSMDDPTICENAMKAVLATIRSLPYSPAPFLVAISTTGISTTRDVPYLLFPIYHGMLKVPHKDKCAMEERIVAAGPLLSGFTIVRPTLLTDGDEKGADRIRVGDENKPALGFKVSRKDVGAWIFRELVVGDAGRWVGEKVTLAL